MSSAEAEILERASGAVSHLLGGGILGARVIGAGGNNRLIRVERRGEPACAVKIYFRHPTDKRDRLATEFSALSFLWRHGVRCIPQPLAADRVRGIGIYSYISGHPVDVTRVKADEIDAATAMLAALFNLRSADGVGDIEPASEAFFSLDELFANLRDRFARNAEADGPEQSYAAYRAFRDGPLRDALDRFEGLVRTEAARSGKSSAEEIPMAARTLSPSDFGFHNAIRKTDGSLVFLDFEYFGWDDPAKTVCDFCYHPAMSLPTALQGRFADSAVAVLGGETLRRRVFRLAPIFGLKWCLILLNEFLPHVRLRRTFANTRPGSADEMLARQLAKSRAMLERVIGEHERTEFAGLRP